VGLLAEEVDARSGEMIGNFPQAFSHIGLVNAAWAITQARQRAAQPDWAAAAAPNAAVGAPRVAAAAPGAAPASSDRAPSGGG
jgi:hypothetical protein